MLRLPRVGRPLDVSPQPRGFTRPQKLSVGRPRDASPAENGAASAARRRSGPGRPGRSRPGAGRGSTCNHEGSNTGDETRCSCPQAALNPCQLSHARLVTSPARVAPPLVSRSLDGPPTCPGHRVRSLGRANNVPARSGRSGRTAPAPHDRRGVRGATGPERVRRPRPAKVTEQRRRKHCGGRGTLGFT